MKQPIHEGSFSLQATTCGTAWVLPGGEWVYDRLKAERIARKIAAKLAKKDSDDE